MAASQPMLTTKWTNVSVLPNPQPSPAAPVIPACWPVLIDPTTQQLLSSVGTDPKFLGVIGSAIGFTVFTVGIYLETLWFFCRKIPSRRKVQLSFILGIYPVFSVCSLLAMLVPRASIISMFTAHIYFSMALVQFIMLVTGYYGQKEEMLNKLQGTVIQLATPPLTMCCFCCFPKIPANKFTLPVFVKVIRLLVVQAAIIKPLFYFLGAILWLNGSFVPGDFSASGSYLWFNLIFIFSTLFALNAIIILVRLSKEPLKEYQLMPKFLTIQLTLIITNVQSFTIGLCAIAGNIACKPPFHPGMRALYLDSMLNIIEMFIFNILATACFRRVKGNIGNAQYGSYLERQYSRLSESSFRQEPVQQITQGDMNDRKMTDSEQKIKGEYLEKPQNHTSMTNNGTTNVISSSVFQQYGNDIDDGDDDQEMLLHVVTEDDGTFMTNSCHVQSTPKARSIVSLETDEMTSDRLGLASKGLSGSNQETNV